MLVTCALLAFPSCGVKLPPVAPQSDPVAPPPLKLDCSPNDETCDKTDPNYRPRKR
jgi:hypothetical protein